MKLYDGGRASNPRRVTIFLKEKGLTVPTVPVDMAALGHRAPEVTRLNPFQRLPVLELDDGTVITESVAICRYLEELHPDPPLFGHDALEKALVEMWNRRVELIYFAAVAAAFRHLHSAMAGWEVPQVPEWGQVNKPKALDFLVFLDGELANRCCIRGRALLDRRYYHAGCLRSDEAGADHLPTGAYPCLALVSRNVIPPKCGNCRGMIAVADSGALADLRRAVAACRICRDHPLRGPEDRLPHEPRPVAVISTSARILIAGQAPGSGA